MLLHPVRRSLVNDRPEHAQLLYRVDEAGEVDRFHHVGVHAQVVAGDQVLLLARRGEDHHRHPLQRRVRANLPQHFEAVLAWHLDVEQYDSGVAGLAVLEGPLAAQVLHRLHAVVRYRHTIGEVVLGERLDGELHVVGVVFGEQDAGDIDYHDGFSFRLGRAKSKPAPLSRTKNTSWAGPPPSPPAPAVPSMAPTSMRAGALPRENFTALPSRFAQTWRSKA